MIHWWKIGSKGHVRCGSLARPTHCTRPECRGITNVKSIHRIQAGSKSAPRFGKAVVAIELFLPDMTSAPNPRLFEPTGACLVPMGLRSYYLNLTSISSLPFPKLVFSLLLPGNGCYLIIYFTPGVSSVVIAVSVKIPASPWMAHLVKAAHLLDHQGLLPTQRALSIVIYISATQGTRTTGSISPPSRKQGLKQNIFCATNSLQDSIYEVTRNVLSWMYPQIKLCLFSIR